MLLIFIINYFYQVTWEYAKFKIGLKAYKLDWLTKLKDICNKR